jgi:hypothetical protein
MADLSATPIASLAGDQMVQHFRRRSSGNLILNVGIDRQHGNRLLHEGAGDLIAFGREYIANPDLVERIRLNAPLNEQRPEGYYGSSHVGYTDYPSLTDEHHVSSTPAVKEGAHVKALQCRNSRVLSGEARRRNSVDSGGSTCASSRHACL